MIRNGCFPFKITALKRSCVVCVRVNPINFFFYFIRLELRTNFALSFLLSEHPANTDQWKVTHAVIETSFGQDSGLQDRPLVRGPACAVEVKVVVASLQECLPEPVAAEVEGHLHTMYIMLLGRSYSVNCHKLSKKVIPFT